MNHPHIYVFDEASEHAAAESLAETIASLGIKAPLVIGSAHGRALVAVLLDRTPHPLAPRHPKIDADQTYAAELGAAAADGGADALVVAGGGRSLDVAKLAAARAGLPVVVVPTQLSHDGICSPVAVVPNSDGRTESLGAVAPLAVFVSIPTLVGAPVESLRAGLGDLLANPLALRDWKLARERGLEELDQRAWDLSVESFELIEPHLDSDPAHLRTDPKFLRRLADALVLSGLAMIHAGTSRPASGAEHEISHAIDETFGGRALHGAQVAFGCVVSVALYGDDTGSFIARLERLGLPHHPRALGLDEDDAVKLILAAPETRPGRFTILEDANLDEAAARLLVRAIWPE